MDPITEIDIATDSTFAMLLEAQRRGHVLWYIEPGELGVRDGTAVATIRRLEVRDDANEWFALDNGEVRALSQLDYLLMRKDPPFNMSYIYATYALDMAEDAGVLVVNRPQALRDSNEKWFITRFPQCCAPTTITPNVAQILEFIERNGMSVVKPLDRRGADSVFQARPDDPNLNVILETLTRNGLRHIMVQRYIPEIVQGDKRILMIDGDPIPYALARVPKRGDFRGNMVKGGSGSVVPLTHRDYWICDQLGPEFRRRGILFAGIDVIGDYLSEINITSPTCIRQLDAACELNIASTLFDAMERHRRASQTGS